MRRAAIAVVVLLALALPASAPAGWTGYSGTFEPGGTLSFGLEKTHGKRYVVRWRWSEFPVQCAEGAQATEGRYVFWLRVRHREFGGRAVLRGASGRIVGGAKVEGEFRPGYGTAEGTFRVYGRTPEPYHDCESGNTPWTAARDVPPSAAAASGARSRGRRWSTPSPPPRS